jgi:peptidoglycan hydrolase-like amidase
MGKILLALVILVCLSCTMSCRAPETVTLTETKTETVTATKTLTETATVTVTITALEPAIVIRVKRTAHGDGQIVALDMETEYLPVVVACENRLAPYESLKAQAIASRTYALYKKLYEPSGTANYDVEDSEADQVYNPETFDNLTEAQQDRIRLAVKETEGLVIRWGNVVICSSYVSGTEVMLRFVTFNEGKSGDAITQTTLNWTSIPPSKYPYNRGCMGQIQANDLASINAYDYERILKYFYGSDILISKYLEDS